MAIFDESDYKKMRNKLFELKIGQNNIKKFLYEYWKKTDIFELLMLEKMNIDINNQNHTPEQINRLDKKWRKQYNDSYNLFLDSLRPKIINYKYSSDISRLINDYILEIKNNIKSDEQRDVFKQDLRDALLSSGKNSKEFEECQELISRIINQNKNIETRNKEYKPSYKVKKILSLEKISKK